MEISCWSRHKLSASWVSLVEFSCTPCFQQSSCLSCFQPVRCSPDNCVTAKTCTSATMILRVDAHSAIENNIFLKQKKNRKPFGFFLKKKTLKKHFKKKTLKKNLQKKLKNTFTKKSQNTPLKKKTPYFFWKKFRSNKKAPFKTKLPF